MFYAMGGLSQVPKLIRVRRKETVHGGSTPKLAPRSIKPFRHAGPATEESSTRDLRPEVGPPASPGLVGISPAFAEEDVPSLVARDKSFIFFGRAESVAGAALVYRPMVELGIAIRTGLLRKRVEIRYLVIDGPSGRFVDLRGTPMMYDGLQRLLDLSEEQIGILREVDRGRDLSMLEVANKVGVSKEMLRRPLKALEERRLVRSFQAGRSKLFRRVYDFPELRWQDSELHLEEVKVPGRVEKSRVTEAKLRETVKGLLEHAEIQEYREFVYPLYRVELVMKRRKRIVWLDGRSGNEGTF